MKSRSETSEPNEYTRNRSRNRLADPFSAIIDLPPRTRQVIIVAGLASLTMFGMANLMSGGQAHYVQIDKIVHFVGYTILAFLFTVGLNPKQCIVAMIILTFFGLAMEYLQLQSGRVFDLLDQLANMSGIIFGYIFGALSKLIFNYIKAEINIDEINRNTIVLNSGEKLFSEFDKSDVFYLIKSGRIRLVSGENGNALMVGEAGPGEVVGEMGLIENKPRSATATASEDTVLVAMSVEKLFSANEVSEKDHPATTVIQVLAKRLRETNGLVKRLQTQRQTINDH